MPLVRANKENLAKLQQNGVAITLPANGTGAALMMLDRGYTSHEHLAKVGLIHMNGRLYDPVLRSFLMPDNFIQQPENTQNYNRYAYVLNNPLMYTDPSGEDIVFGVAVLIGAAIAATTYTLTALLADVPFSVGGLAKATFIGAASAAVTFGIGSAAGSLFTNFYSQAAFQAAAHSTFQGTMTAISGGKFWSGFASGALSSIASSAWSGGGNTSNYHGAGRFANSGAGMIAFGTVSGGAGAALTGGNFWQGAATGLVVSELNHYAHIIKIKNEIENKYPGLYKVLSRLKSYVMGNSSVLESMSNASGYSKPELLKLLKLRNLVNLVGVGDTDGEWEIFRQGWSADDSNPSNIFFGKSTTTGADPYHIYIRENLASSPDNGGYKDSYGTNESLKGSSFFAGVTVLHELVHYGRFWNGLTQSITIGNITNYEAGQVFETNAFGNIQGINGSTQNAIRNGW